MATNVGTGTTAVFGTSAFAADLLRVGWGGITRDVINTSHMGTTLDHTFMPVDLVDNGELTLEMAFIGDLDPPIDGAIETLTIDFAGVGIGHKSSASIFVTGVEIDAGLEDKMTLTLTCKVTGAITIS